ncbi:MAG: hypothetical protein NTY14_08040 [Candidatus Omnitrophica bacterium]|nr:hypothetical protein [Candidatus Omnitrophota bacterium]
MKKLAIAIAIIMVIIGGLIIFKNIIAGNLVVQGVKKVTGLTLEIGSLDIGVFKPVVAVSDLKLFNPSGYPDKLMADLPAFYADYDLAAFLKGKVHFRQLKINLKSLEVAKNEKSKVNLEFLEALKPKGSGPAPDIKIDKLVLDIGKVSYKDYSMSTKPTISEYNINIHETYENIDNPQSLVKIILAKALLNTRIGDLAKIDLSALKNELNNVAAPVSKILKGSAGTVEQSAQEIKDVLKGLIPAQK